MVLIKVIFYFTNALSKFIKIFNQNIDIKYNILNSEYPNAFLGTNLKLKILKDKVKSERLKNKSIIITESFFNKEFNSPPSNSSKERLNELIKELALLEYVKPDNFIIKSKDQNLSQASTSKLVEIDQAKLKKQIL